MELHETTGVNVKANLKSSFSSIIEGGILNPGLLWTAREVRKIRIIRGRDEHHDPSRDGDYHLCHYHRRSYRKKKEKLVDTIIAPKNRSLEKHLETRNLV